MVIRIAFDLRNSFSFTTHFVYPCHRSTDLALPLSNWYTHIVALALFRAQVALTKYTANIRGHTTRTAYSCTPVPHEATRSLPCTDPTVLTSPTTPLHHV